MVSEKEILRVFWVGRVVASKINPYEDSEIVGSSHSTPTYEVIFAPRERLSAAKG